MAIEHCVSHFHASNQGYIQQNEDALKAGATKSGAIADMARKLGGRGLTLEQASAHDFFRNNFTFVRPSEEASEKTKLFHQQHGPRYLDKVPAAGHRDIFNAFEPDGVTPDSIGGQRAMVVSADLEGSSKMKLLSALSKDDKASCIEMVRYFNCMSLLNTNQCIFDISH